jgi:hypothetical protein
MGARRRNTGRESRYVIEIQVEAVCDWCGIRKSIDPNTAYLAVAEWEAVVGELEERPTSLAEVVAELGVESGLQILCPDCSEHVAWNDDGKLLAIDETGAALQGTRTAERV